MPAARRFAKRVATALQQRTHASKICRFYAGFGDAVSDSVLIERTLAEVSGVHVEWAGYVSMLQSWGRAFDSCPPALAFALKTWLTLHGRVTRCCECLLARRV
jgi:hypothetical protein